MPKQFSILAALILITSFMVSSCGGSQVVTLKIVSSLPLTGSAKPQAESIVNAMLLRVEEAGNKACNGKYKIVYESWDDASAELGRWDPEVEIKNATQAAKDPSIIAYLGTVNSGAAKLSIPILNQAGPLVMISPANTYPGLTYAVNGITEANEPDVYYPNGIRNFARLVATDDLQGPVAVNFMVAQGIKSIYILDDQGMYGKGISGAVNLAAQKAGIQVIAHEGYDPKAADYLELMKKISISNNGGAPDAIYLGAIIGNNAAKIMEDKVTIMGDNETVKFIGGDGIYTAGWIEAAGAANAEGAFVTTPGLALADLGKAGQKFYANYTIKYGETTEAYPIMGYETMSVALKAIENVCAADGDPTDRKSIRDAVFSINEFEGALGTWSFDANGDITIPYFLVGQVKNGKFVQVGTYTP